MRTVLASLIIRYLRQMQTNKCYSRGLLLGLIGTLIFLLALLASSTSPVFNEIGHLPAGLANWQGYFQLYRVNPPLPRMVAVLPCIFMECLTDWSNFGMDSVSREEIPMGIRFANVNGKKVFWIFTVTRWACIPFSLLGAWITYRWAKELWGEKSGLMACALWCFDPAILGNGSLVMPDVPAAALGLGAIYVFWHWLRKPTWKRAFWSGIVLGLAEMCKMTLLIYFFLIPILWLLWSISAHDPRSSRWWLWEPAMLSAILVTALLMLNLGYCFTGSFKKIGEFRFLSRTLSGRQAADNAIPGNRFVHTWLGQMPAPLPADYLQGIDRQWTDFELGSRSYLHGEWRERGWWYYYLYALAIKMPLGTCTLFLLAVASCFITKESFATWRDELVLLLPAVALLALISSQTGFSIHSRYSLPILPFSFIWISKVGKRFPLRHWKFTAAVGVALCWMIGSSLWQYPHSLSYFNESVGGAINGHRYLLDSNIAWGQDLLFLKIWLDSRPEAKPVGLASFGWMHPELVGINFNLPPFGPRTPLDASIITNPCQLGPRPGWYAIDVNYLHASHWPAASPGLQWTMIPTTDLNYEYFLHFHPVATAGYSIYIYHLTLDDVNPVRRKLGLAELPSSGSKEKGTAMELTINKLNFTKHLHTASMQERHKQPTLTVVVPIYNEAQTIDELLRRVAASPYPKQVIVVNDGSTDWTTAVLENWQGNPHLELLHHSANRGKGAAIRTGLAYARGRFTIIQDADLEYDPADYPLLIEPLLMGKAQVVYGSRYLVQQPLKLQNVRWLRWGVSVLNFCVRLLYGVRLSDEATCYKAFSTELLRKLDLQCERFEFCPEVTAKLCRLGIKIEEVPIHYEARNIREGKKLRWTDGIAALKTLWKYRNWSSGATVCDNQVAGSRGRTR